MLPIQNSLMDRKGLRSPQTDRSRLRAEPGHPPTLTKSLMPFELQGRSERLREAYLLRLAQAPKPIGSPVDRAQRHIRLQGVGAKTRSSWKSHADPMRA